MTPTRTTPGGVFFMPVTLLNDNQERRLATHLRLLASDLETLAQSAELQTTGPPYARVREAIAAAHQAAERMRETLALPADRAPSLKRRIAAVAEVWAVRMEDLRARRLKSWRTPPWRCPGATDDRLHRAGRDRGHPGALPVPGLGPGARRGGGVPPRHARDQPRGLVRARLPDPLRHGIDGRVARAAGWAHDRLLRGVHDDEHLQLR